MTSIFEDLNAGDTVRLYLAGGQVFKGRVLMLTVDTIFIATAWPGVARVPRGQVQIVEVKGRWQTGNT